MQPGDVIEWNQAIKAGGFYFERAKHLKLHITQHSKMLKLQQQGFKVLGLKLLSPRRLMVLCTPLRGRAQVFCARGWFGFWR